MLIDAQSRPEALREQGLRWHLGRDRAIGWKGLLYVPGYAAGSPSVEQLAKVLTEQPLAQAVQRLAGVFGLFVFDRQRSEWQVATDNAGLYKIFYDTRGASTGFLELARARGYGSSNLDMERIYEFLTLGIVTGGVTVLEDVRMVRANEILTFDAHDPKLLEKELPVAGTHGEKGIAQYFADLAGAIKQLRVSADVTGGFDSRLIAGMLHHHGVGFEIAITGEQQSLDVQIARKIAAALGKPFEPLTQDLDDLESELPATFRDADGLIDIRRFHRDRQNALARLARGVELITHGGGADQYRENNYIQDFPRFGSRAINFERYYNIRFAPIKFPESQLAQARAGSMERFKARMMDAFRRAPGTTNNQRFDSISFLLKQPYLLGHHFASYINLGLDVAAPYLDRRNMMEAIGLSPWRRLMHGWHRPLITKYCPPVALIPTTESRTASSGWLHLSVDVVAFTTQLARRVVRKLGQQITGRSYFEKAGSATHNAPGFLDQLRATSHFRRGFAKLKAIEVLAPNLRPEDLLPVHVSRVLTAGMLVDWLDDREGATERVRATAEPVS